MKKLEVLADSIMLRSGYLDPLDHLYVLRNPGGLKAHSDKHTKDDKGYRVFEKHIDGYRALIYDLEVKCKGNSNCGLKSNSPLKELAYVFDLKDGDIRNMLKHLRKALGFETLSENTPLMFFLE
jgi:hypothetical protein